MSVAFTREDSAETAAEVELPDRPISSHPNLVTANGLEWLETSLATARAAYDVARRIEDVNERRRASAPAGRDMRYFAERVRTARLMPVPSDTTTVAFGHHVRFRREDGREQSFQIVGEDEANPSKGTISYVSPVAKALIGKTIDNVAIVAGQELEILSIG